MEQNHLIETASVQTGSMLIWDTGAYEVLPYQSSNVEADLETTDEDEDDSEEERSMHGTPEYSSLRTEQEKLAQAFDNRKIRLRLHGARLPKDYTISLRLSSQEDRSQQPKAPSRKRKRGQSNLKKTTSQTKAQAIHPRNDESSSDAETTASDYPDEGSRDGANGKPNVEGDEESRITNTYPGASNTINSIYQRRWYLNFDRRSSGFIPQMKWEGERKRIWARKRRKDGALDGFEPFRVMGAEIERSIVTGRTAKQVLVDEGVSGYESRRGWRAVVE
ncbi:uncharacterized protein KY384_001852 [Bacidia gigantensis]|uniref:uncharacterized protein n=1 Tax=Bacidia gigantensis TaxID=2732470 RepID=UPI001D04F6BA|nr:uncharacterized protein KY384_001852 [Bacidia gigantensis]KAG8533069.1 hypothetical protein KY384_001852 [Bacidia gigantensis]